MNYYKNIEELLSLKLLKEVSHLVNDKSKIELVKIIKKYTKKELRNRIINIATFIKYNVSSEVSWCDRIFLIKNVLKNDSSSLKSFIIRYGEKDGEKLFLIKNNKTKPILDCSNITEWKKRYENVGESLDKYIKLYGEKNGIVKWNEYRNKTIFKKQKYSKISQELFWYVYDILNEKQKKFVYFAEKNSEYFFRKNKTIIFADFKLKNIIVEFDGEYWHSSKETKIRDKIKDNIYYENNCFLLRINERDYLNDKNNVINTVVEFINKNIKYD